MNQSDHRLDLKSVPCPLNVVKCKLALENLSTKDILIVELDRGEPEIMVKESMTSMGFKIKLINKNKHSVRLAISYATK